MIPGVATRSSWDQRLARAAELAEIYPSAAEVLRFYIEVATLQRSLYADLQVAGHVAAGTRSLPEYLDVRILLRRSETFLRELRDICRPELSAAVRELEQRDLEYKTRLLLNHWQNGGRGEFSVAEEFVARVFLQPLAQYLADMSDCDRGPNYAGSLCPFCGRKPSNGVLRPEGDGARRSLVCSFCTTEWQFRRVLCPSCGGTDLLKLPVFIADEFENIRVEACDDCRTFFTTVDVSKNGRSDPIVDELAAIPLALWAQQNGYRKLETNLLNL